MSDVYDVTLDGNTAAQFSSITKAKAYAKTLKGKGKVRIFHSIIGDDKRQTKASSVPKKAKNTLVTGKAVSKKEMSSKPKTAVPMKKSPVKDPATPKKASALPKKEMPSKPKAVVKKAASPITVAGPKTADKPKIAVVDDRFSDPQTYVKAWYVGAFPRDKELFADLRPDATFGDVLRATILQKDVYDVFGVNDSTVRERIFDELAKRNSVPYDTIYDCWMGETSWSPADVGDDGIVKKRPVAPVVKKPAEKPPAPEKPKASPKAPKRSTAKKAPTNEQFLKRLAGVIQDLGDTTVPVYSSKFALLSPDRQCMLYMENPNGTSLFGFQDNGDDSSRVDLWQIAKVKGPYETDGTSVSGVPIQSIQSWANLKAVDHLAAKARHDLDVEAFQRMIEQSYKMFYLRSDQNRIGARINLSCDGMDLYATFDDSRRLIKIDIGDGKDKAVSEYLFQNLYVASKLISLSDRPVQVRFKENFPLAVLCGCEGWDIRLFASPIPPS